MRTLFITLLTIGLTLTAHAGKGDGGGGGFNIGGKYVTWDKAGVKLRDKERAFDLDAETIQGEKDLTENLPFSEAWFAIAIGKENVFKLAEKVGRTLKNRIRDEYALCFDNKEFKKKRRKFTVYAVSRTLETFLMPEFFELDPISRAKILIHEAHVRAHGFSCDTLRLDEQISLAYEAKQGNVDLADVELTTLRKHATELSARVSMITMSKLSHYSDNALLADFENRNIEFPANLILDEQSVQDYFKTEATKMFENYQKEINKSFRRKIIKRTYTDIAKQVSKYMPPGHTNEWSRMDKLNTATLPDEVYHLVSLYKASIVSFIPAEMSEIDRLKRASMKSKKMIKHCENREPDEVFILRTEAKDFWNLESDTFIAQCEKRDDGVYYALPQLYLRAFLRDDGTW